MRRICGGAAGAARTNETADTAQTDAAEVQYDHQLRAGGQTEVHEVTSDRAASDTAGSVSTGDASADPRSSVRYENCVFNGGLAAGGGLPDADFLGVCGVYEGDAVTHIRLGIG